MTGFIDSDFEPTVRPTRDNWKRPGTSAEAAAAAELTAQVWRDRVLADITRHGPQTPHDVAQRYGVEVTTVRPRFTELGDQGKIAPNGERRKTPSGKSAMVWALVTADVLRATQARSA